VTPGQLVGPAFVPVARGVHGSVGTPLDHGARTCRAEGDARPGGPGWSLGGVGPRDPGRLAGGARAGAGAPTGPALARGGARAAVRADRRRRRAHPPRVGDDAGAHRRGPAAHAADAAGSVHGGGGGAPQPDASRTCWPQLERQRGARGLALARARVRLLDPRRVAAGDGPAPAPGRGGLCRRASRSTRSGTPVAPSSPGSTWRGRSCASPSSTTATTTATGPSTAATSRATTACAPWGGRCCRSTPSSSTALPSWFASSRRCSCGLESDASHDLGEGIMGDVGPGRRRARTSRGRGGHPLAGWSPCRRLLHPSSW